MAQLNTATVREVDYESPPFSNPTNTSPLPRKCHREQPVMLLVLSLISEYEAKERYIRGEILYVSSKKTANIMECGSLWIKYNKPFNAAMEAFKHKNGRYNKNVYYYISATRSDD